MSVTTRPALAGDAAAIASIYSFYVTDSTASFEAVPPSSEEVGSRMASGMPWYVAESERSVLGYAYSSVHRDRAAYRWSVDVSVYLAADSRRHGTGRLLYTRLLAVLTDLGHVRAHAGITLPNEASVALHESMGFVQVATYPQVGFKHGAWHDVGWWSRPLAQAALYPVDPQRWDGLA